jgi:hypothetical protein
MPGRRRRSRFGGTCLVSTLPHQRAVLPGYRYLVPCPSLQPATETDPQAVCNSRSDRPYRDSLVPKQCSVQDRVSATGWKVGIGTTRRFRRSFLYLPHFLSCASRCEIRERRQWRAPQRRRIEMDQVRWCCGRNGSRPRSRRVWYPDRHALSELQSSHYERRFKLDVRKRFLSGAWLSIPQRAQLSLNPTMPQVIWKR